MSQLLNNNSYYRVYAQEVDANVMKVSGVNVGETLQELQAEIDVLQPANIEAITNAILFPSADTFSTQPFQVAPYPNQEVPTDRGIFIGKNFSGFVVEGTASDKYGAMYMKEDNQLNFDCNDGEGKINLNGSNISTNCTTVELSCSESVVMGQSGNNLTFAPLLDNTFSISTGGEASANTVNFQVDHLQLNGVDITTGGGGGSLALEQTFATEPVSTFATQPVIITAVDASSCEMLLNKGGRFSIMAPDGSAISTIEVDNSNNVNIDCNSLLVNGDTVSNNAITETINFPAQNTFITAPVIITSITDQKCQMNLAKGSNLNLQSPDTTKNASVYVEDNDSLNISGVAQTNVDSGLRVKTGNQLQIANNSDSNVGFIYNTYNEFTMESTGATNLYLKSGGNKIYAEAPVLVKNEFSVIATSGGESKAVWANDGISKYVEMKYLTNSTDQLNINNSTGAGVNIEGGHLFDHG